MTKPSREQLCREWIARRTAKLDQMEKRFQQQYDFVSPTINLRRMEEIEALRFWVSIHQWELDEMIRTGNDPDEYPMNDGRHD